MLDKQLDEREHTVEEWKGQSAFRSALPAPVLHRKLGLIIIADTGNITRWKTIKVENNSSTSKLFQLSRSNDAGRKMNVAENAISIKRFRIRES